ncbi:MAG: urease accessory protein UreE [Xanthobacteraceae bacterium]|nr:urease accessory protein UreE [Xanthobacteraceae bacterium]MBV9626845.1 urease accessory protein UreE [Xanthobacteraceae bacterium]
MAVKPVGAWNAREAIDRVVLDADDRQRRRIVLTGENGTRFLLDLKRPISLRNGDGLVLDDGGVVEVHGAAEPLIEISGRGFADMLRFAWHIGNRHTDLQIVGDRLRIRRDHVLEAMLAQMGASLAPIDAPFDPEAVPQAAGAVNHDH